ncbi:MAG TPA: type II toxin-antitoxin system HicB family antitoxin, partial [Anaerovoracaceae bacterium]|nr:type II toxin-antitoxin system HicB family antitoxin [Anaerovoracaceae bacterium]
MLFVYPAIFHKENESYWVEFPDLVGCQTYGSTLNETMEFAQEALAAYVMTLLDDGTDIPAPSELTDISTEKE